MSIRIKLIIILLLFSIVPVAIIGLYEIREGQKALKKQIGGNSLELARLALNRVGEYVHSKHIEIERWAKHESMKDISTDDRDGHTSRFLMGSKDNYEDYYYVNCLNKKGQIVASSNTKLIGNDSSTDTGFMDALNGRLSIQDVAFNEEAGGYAVIFSVPIKGIQRKSETIGVLSTALKWDKVSEMISGLKVKGKEQNAANHFMLTKQDGLVISCFEPDEMFKTNLVEIGMKSAQYAKERKEGSIVEISEHEFKSFSTYTYRKQHEDVHSFGWNLILLQDYESIFTHTFSMEKMMTSVLISIIVFLVLISFLIANRVSKPILAVASAVGDIGKGNLVTRVSVKSNDEIGLLSDAFNKMAKDLQDSTDLSRKAHEQLQSIMDNTTSVIYLKDKHGKYILVNRQYESLFHITREDIIGKTDMDIFPGEEAEVFQSNDRKVLKAGVALEQEETVLLNGESYTYISVKFPLFDSNGIPDRVCGILTDITERKKMEETQRKSYDTLNKTQKASLNIMEDLSRQRKELDASLEEKEVLLREIHHRVKNNMQVISSLIKFQSENVKEEQYVEMFKECQNRIRAMSLIHEKLYRSDDIANIQLDDYVKNLTNEVFRSYRKGTAKIGLKINVEDISIGIDTAIPCGLVINELMSNSMKYAFPDGREGEIKISMRSISDFGLQNADLKSEIRNPQSEIELVFSDNGVGIPEDIDYRNTESLGLHLIVKLTEHQLGGKVELDRSKGTEFRIRFKELKYKKRI